MIWAMIGFCRNAQHHAAFLTCVKFDCIISVVFYGCYIRCNIILFSKRLHKLMLRVGMTLKGQRDTQWL